MNRFSYLLVILTSGFFLLFFLGCKSSQFATGKKYQLRYIPKTVSGVYLGMSMEEAKKARPAMKFVRDDSFRKVYEELIGKEKVLTTGYYFDDDENGTLYEIIIDYENSQARDVVVSELFGTPNYAGGKEWLYESKEGFNIHAWTFSKKLVIAGNISGTEWGE